MMLGKLEEEEECLRVLYVEGKITLKLIFKVFISVGCIVQYYGKVYW